ncbi:Uncharacterised protein [Vibrio cholerae]|nr:Uncharacterised protein [Vibrio cholerae]
MRSRICVCNSALCVSKLSSAFGLVGSIGSSSTEERRTAKSNWPAYT